MQTSNPVRGGLELVRGVLGNGDDEIGPHSREARAARLDNTPQYFTGPSALPRFLPEHIFGGMDHDLDNDKRNITISRLPKALYAELAQAAGGRTSSPVLGPRSLPCRLSVPRYCFKPWKGGTTQVMRRYCHTESGRWRDNSAQSDPRWEFGTSRWQL